MKISKRQLRRLIKEEIEGLTTPAQLQQHVFPQDQFPTSHRVNQNNFVAGFGNTTSAVDAIQFKMSSGNIDSGTITLYGIN